MATIELNENELAVIRSALESYLEQFGHEEMDTVKSIQSIYAKVGGEPAKISSH